MSFTRSLSLLALAATVANACPKLQKRQGVNATLPEDPRFWAYEASYDWGRLDPEWVLCQAGTQQSPIPLRLDQGLSRAHIPTFSYPSNVTGNFSNWGYGPSYTLSLGPNNNDDYTTLPSLTFPEEANDFSTNETVYLASWHIHAPADHTVQGDRSKAELHLVHADAEGHERAVFAIRIDPGNAESRFFSQLPGMVGFNNTDVRETEVTMDLNLALDEVLRFAEFWTYKGSLTSPPCTEGLRWFVARNVLFVSDEQMQDILRVSTFSARTEQEVWRHDINI
ncbi:hypothetical protein CKM354_001138000 [Cercospora kikuchii]|uniref:Alpha-carbonic anhydrase domain-containing protein n=1 Tax=Cercospora kikuchii TaxID=84275 RepID=A0A9P3D097_9PEZI|nr:uncharacterized protein CKM354_001138000 [Cercospora kikuchii]GIZ48313.1 hypothetical protein CKM354_001138000 [Cercospora kikuchii]